MQASNRVVYGREFKVTPLWMWMLQRASGVLLGPLVTLHVWAPALASNRALSAVLLAVILAHGYTGLRRIAVKRDKAGITQAVAVLWCVVVLAFGAMLVLHA
jgi:succinate dehydrogenase hydrophobic anchor subunit